MKIAYLGAGTWGFCLASLLGAKGYSVVLWTAEEAFAKQLQETRQHPKLPQVQTPASVSFTADLEEALEGADWIVESVTSKGIRPVFESLVGRIHCPIVLTSKGIEQNTGLLLPEVVIQVCGEAARAQVGCLSGPSHAEEVMLQLPTSVVASAYNPDVMLGIASLFSTPVFRVYPNADINGVALGGAMKNIVAIACGISDGLGFGDNTKAALMTRGLHEIRKLARLKGCNPETLNGLSGMGDLCVTCLSKLSRNYRFGQLIAQELSSAEAQEVIGMVVEGAYTCVSAAQLASKHQVPAPITEAVYSILYGDLKPRDAVKSLFQRAIKEEHL